MSSVLKSSALTAAAVAVLVLSTHPAKAQPGSHPYAAPENASNSEPGPERYYSQTLTADGIGFLSFLGGGLAEGPGGRDSDASGVLFSLGMGTMLLATPFIHLSHGNWASAGKSLLMRVTIPFAVGGLAMALNDCRGDDQIVPCEVNAFGPGVLAGFALVAAIDATYLAKKKRPRTERAWTPTAGMTRGGATVGFAATW